MNRMEGGREEEEEQIEAIEAGSAWTSAGGVHFCLLDQNTCTNT